MAYFTELPGDEYGNRGYTSKHPQVIEATLADDSSGQSLNVIAPPTFQWPSVSLRGWVEVPGPVRMLTEAEYFVVLQEAGVETKYLRAAAIRARIAFYS